MASEVTGQEVIESDENAAEKVPEDVVSTATKGRL